MDVPFAVAVAISQGLYGCHDGDDKENVKKAIG